MPESEEERRERRQANKDRQKAREANRRSQPTPNQARKKKVAMASAVLAVLGVLGWLAVYFIEIETGFGLHVVFGIAQLWPVLAGAAAIGWIIHEALPDD